jgi:hypothetical protein
METLAAHILALAACYQGQGPAYVLKSCSLM